MMFNQIDLSSAVSSNDHSSSFRLDPAFKPSTTKLTSWNRKDLFCLFPMKHLNRRFPWLLFHIFMAHMSKVLYDMFSLAQKEIILVQMTDGRSYQDFRCIVIVVSSACILVYLTVDLSNHFDCERMRRASETNIVLGPVHQRIWGRGR